MMLSRPLKGAKVLKTTVHALDWEQVVSLISEWSANRDSRVVSICNVHSVVTASIDETFAAALRAADLVTPDGAPVAWMLRRAGFRAQRRISGPDLMEKYCALAAARHEPIFIYGSTPAVMSALSRSLEQRFPGIIIAGAISPPFRSLTDEEDLAMVKAINESGARVVWVGLGCPKQELWMAEHRGRVRAVMVGVGAGFDYMAGTLKRAPRWMRKSGLEWLHRLTTEPKRLARRYFLTNTLFVIGVAAQFATRLFRRGS
jgi:N-acetylglucosaminyldiphosphoundecaprenol N-acetyl-beta-D-mannosaminyltransferase